MNAAATKPGRTRRLKNPSFEVDFFFMGSVRSYSFLFPAEVVLCNCGSGRDEEPNEERSAPPGFRFRLVSGEFSKGSPMCQDKLLQSTNG